VSRKKIYGGKGMERKTWKEGEGKKNAGKSMHSKRHIERYAWEKKQR
jgi:hypothetical protein